MSGSQNAADDIDSNLADLPSGSAGQGLRILVGALALAGTAFLSAGLAGLPNTLPIAGAVFVVGLLIMGVVAARLGRLSSRARPVDGARLERAVLATQPPVAPAERVLRGAALPLQPIAIRMPAGNGEMGIADAAEHLISGSATRALFISPEGDEAAASSVLVTRDVADAGLRVLLLDLTVTGAAALPMLENNRLPGITDLLAAQAQFTAIIHPDLYSDAHVIPAGTADAALAARSIARLPIILDALETAYDLVVVECGPAEAASIQKLMGERAEIMISALEPHERLVAETAAALEAAGHHAFSLVSPARYEAPQALTGRTAA